MSDIAVANKIKQELVESLGVQANEIDPELIKLSLDIGEKLSKGETCLAAVLHIPKNKLDAMYAIAYQFYTTKKYDKAVNVFTLLSLYDPLNTNYWEGLGAACKGLGDYSRAAVAYYTLTQLRSTQMNYLFMLAECLFHINQIEGATNCLKGILLLNESEDLKNRGNNNADIVKKAQSLLTILEKKSN